MPASVPERRRRSGVADVVGAAILIIILCFLLLPIIIVVPMSLGGARFLEFPPRNLTLNWYREFLSDPEWREATFFSAKVAILTTLVSVVIGTMAAIALVRGALIGKRVLTAFTLAPLIVPHIVLGIALYLSFTPLGLSGTVLGFVIAHTALAVPFVVLTVSAALYRVDRSLELAAINLGATRFTAFRLVTFPLILPAVAVGGVFAFLASFDEAVVSFFLSGVSTKTLPRKLFENIDFDISPLIPAVATLLMAVSVVMMSGATLFGRKPRASTGTSTS